MTINSLQQAEKALKKYVPNVSRLTGDDMSVSRISKLATLLGNPQDKLNIIHIAGTSGKTSTSYYISAILQQSGKKTALTVSPHINSITERIQIDGSNLSEDKFCKYLGELLVIVEASKLELSYFEVLIALAFVVSEKEKVEYLVLETGMGGLHDASNIADKQDKVCVITDIGFDHMHILGNTLTEIASQKAGIIHKKNHVFAYSQSDEVNHVLKNVSKTKQAELKLFNQEVLEHKTRLDLKDVASYQRRNWLLAEQVCMFIASRDKFKIKYPLTETIKVPARMEHDTLKGKKVVLDGAHNPQKMNTFVSSYKIKFGHEKAVILLALKEGKEYKNVLNELVPISEKIIFTSFKSSQDLPAISENPYSLKDYAQTLGIDSKVVVSLDTALETLLNDENDHKVITGSFYLISQIKKL